MECQWFYLCKNEATKRREHPILEAVPICDSCNAKMDAIEAQTAGGNPPQASRTSS